jgi:hypothetical protein
MKGGSRTSSAEAIRIVKTNLEFMLSTVSEGRAKTILVTSTILRRVKLSFLLILLQPLRLLAKVYLLVWILEIQS